MPVNFLTSAERARLSRFPDRVPESDLIQYFTLTAEDLRRVERQRQPSNRLGFALQLCALRYLGFCPDDSRHAPSEVVEYLARQLGTTTEELSHYARRAQTRTEHSRQVASYLNFRPADEKDLDALAAWLLERAMEHDKPSLLFQLAAEKLYREKIVRPGVTTLERMVSRARTGANGETYRLLEPLLTEGRRTFLDGLLERDKTVRNTRLSWLRRPATANSPAAILTALDKIHYLRAQGVQGWDLSSINPNRLKFLAGLAKKATNQALQRTPPERRYPLLIAFARQMLVEITDEAVDLFIRCLAETHNRARRDLEAFRHREAVALDRKVILLRQLGEVVLDPEVADERVREAIFSRIPEERLREALDDCARLVRPIPDESYDFLAERYSYIRQFAPAFLETFVFRSPLESDPLLKAVRLVRRLNVERKRAVPGDAPREFISPRWQSFIFAPDGQIQRRYYELCLLWELRAALRAGNVWIEGSRRYTDPDTYLIPKSRWERERSEIREMLGMPENGEERLKVLTARLDSELLAFTRTLEGNERVRVEDERLVVSPLEAESLPESVKALRDTISKCLPLVDLTDLIIEVDGWTRFTGSLVHTGGHRSRSGETRVYLYAALLAQACNLGPVAMAQVTDLSYESLLWHTNWYLDDNTLSLATAALVNYHHQLPLARYWGGGTLSSSDGQRFPVAVKNLQATALPRYFGYGKGVTFYTWTSDQFSAYGNKVIPSTARDATYLLDGILDNETDLAILEHTTDTAGYTEVIFALFDLLGLSFAPRIRDIGSQQLYRVKRQMADATLKPLFKSRIDRSSILDCWDDLLRLAGSLKGGWVTASLLLSKLRSLGENNRLFGALQEYGRLTKTLFILRYLNSEDYRRQINRQLNRGESLHALRRFLMFARGGELRKRDPEELTDQSHCLTLVTNAVILWNTVYMAAVLDELKRKGYPVKEEDIAHLSPARFDHINPYGKYRFDLAANQNRQGLRPLRPL